MNDTEALNDFTDEEKAMLGNARPIGSWLLVADGAFRGALDAGGYLQKAALIDHFAADTVALAIGLWLRDTPSLGALFTERRAAAMARAEGVIEQLKRGQWKLPSPAPLQAAGPDCSSHSRPFNRRNQTTEQTAAMSASSPHSSISITRVSPKDALTAYAAIVAKNARITDTQNRDKGKLAAEAGAIFAADLRDTEDAWMAMPLHEAIKAADVSSASVGTLAGTLVLQRSLPLMKYDYPLLDSVFTDFSSEPGAWLGTETTRIPIAPAVTEYDASLDTNGRPKGWAVVTPAQTIDVPITLNKHVGIPMIFGVQTLASTIRNLFGEQTEAAVNALAGYFVGMGTALMTAANFNAYKQVTDAGGETVSGSTTLILASTAGVYPGQEVSGAGIPTGAHIAAVTDSTHAVMTFAATASASGLTITLGGGRVPTLYPTYVKPLADFNMASLGEIGAAFDQNRVPSKGRSVMLNSPYYQRLAQDPTFNTFFAAMRSPGVITKGELPELQGFNPQKAPFFPTSSNRVGFAHHKAAIVLKSRLAADYARAVNAVVPGSITTVTDPDSGLSVTLTQRVDLVGSYAEMLIDVMLGAAPGDRRAGMVLTSE